MKFIITYDGKLPASGNNSSRTKEKWQIRARLSPQLEQLWQVHPSLIRGLRNRNIPRNSSYVDTERHHLSPPADSNVFRFRHDQDTIDLCEPHETNGVKFIPLVRNTYATVCSLNILFMRQGSSGKVYQGGDLDNRIKTLLDALSIPTPGQVAACKRLFTTGETVYCLLEDDSLVTGLSVQTTRLLTAPSASESEVRLVIEVDVKVTDARAYNFIFLGD